jgi:hypothetical protein
LDGRGRWLGLGRHEDIGLDGARERARLARVKILDGIDPIAAKKQEKAAVKAAAALAQAKSKTFEQAAREFHIRNEGRWRNKKTRTAWLNAMVNFVFPVIGSIAVADIDRGLIIKVLERDHYDHDKHPGVSVWKAVPESASRLRGAIEAVLAWATVRGYRTGENPAAWSGNLEHALDARDRATRRNHHPALPWKQIPEFMPALRGRQGTAAAALEFTILCAVRSAVVPTPIGVSIHPGSSGWGYTAVAVFISVPTHCPQGRSSATRDPTVRNRVGLRH